MQCYALPRPTPDMLGPKAAPNTAGLLLPDQLLSSSHQLGSQFIFLCFQLAALKLGQPQLLQQQGLVTLRLAQLLLKLQVLL